MLVLLNGTSSSGKSALLKELHTKLGSCFSIFKIDDYFPQQVEQKARELGWVPQVHGSPWLFLHKYLYGKTGKLFFDTQVRQELFYGAQTYRAICDQVKTGENIIFDTVLEYESEYQAFCEATQDINVCTVLVYCPLDVLLERVRERNEQVNNAEHRTAFLSFEQFIFLYKLQEYAHEIAVDTVTSSSLLAALDRAKVVFRKHINLS